MQRTLAVATEHSPDVLLLQSTALSATVVLFNIDWKASRRNANALKSNMKILAKTITGVVRSMNPAMICMCEVGLATIP